MGYKVRGTTIWLTRGDNFDIGIGADIVDAQGNPTGESYTPQTGDSCRFALKSAKMTNGQQAFADPEPLILKDIPIETMLLSLEPADTKPYPFGKYKYDIELVHDGGLTTTIIEDADFFLRPEVD